MAENPLNWLKVSLHHPPAATEAVSALLFEAGAAGLWEDPPDERGRLVMLAGFPPADQARLEAALPEMVARLAAAFDFPTADFAFGLTLEKNHDWAEKWKEGLKPIPVSSRLAVAPTWWPADDLPAGDIILRIDPGLAFGSGHHATTFMCLAHLAELAPRARRILDLGAGSGILSLACAALNPEAEVVGRDNDPETLAVAEANARANQLTGIDFSVRPLEDLTAPFDLIVANITSGPLMELAPAVSRLTGPGAWLILSGLPEKDAPEVYEVYESLGWAGQQISRQDGWEAGVFLRR
ncbi:MAG: 50S ribosomal protein L11 methyltransferase [Candidatus Adiutrix sp.]|jgi:ribosomal protein L11 methyltransferase|nr:50S ribosomal protein L11 methyltransferase [Candidatus Adiutrix sp.]